MTVKDSNRSTKSKCRFWCRLRGEPPLISPLNWTENGLTSVPGRAPRTTVAAFTSHRTVVEDSRVPAPNGVVPSTSPLLPTNLTRLEVFGVLLLLPTAPEILRVQDRAFRRYRVRSSVYVSPE